MSMITHPFVRDLKERLARAERAFELAKYIDSYDYMQRERAYWATEIQVLKTQIESAEADLRKQAEEAGNG